jgi:hypothetical protein
MIKAVIARAWLGALALFPGLALSTSWQPR